MPLAPREAKGIASMDSVRGSTDGAPGTCGVGVHETVGRSDGAVIGVADDCGIWVGAGVITGGFAGAGVVG
jgi:hypothetical protein